MRAFVLDANIFKTIYDDLVAEADGVGKAALDLILSDDHILIDARGKIRQEWRDCSCGNDDEFFRVWISQRIVEDKIREVPVRANKSLQGALDKFGMPNDDRIYCLTAASSTAFGIVSDDIDLYNPKAKTWSAKKKQELKSGGGACVVRYMKKEFGVTIFPLELIDQHCPAL